MGIGSIDIIDFDRIDKTNLHRTSVFSEKDIGKYKSIVLTEKLKKVNSEVQLNALNTKITSTNIDMVLRGVVA